MKPLPCPRCGSPETLGTFCADCLRELHPFVKTVKPAKLTLCVKCDQVKAHSDWKEMPQIDAVVKALSEALVFSNDVEISSVEFGEADLERKPGIKKTAQIIAVVTGRHQEANKDYEEDYDVPLQYEVTLCPRCSKKGTSYYEGILQIRHQTPAVRDAIHEYLRQHKNVRLAKEVPVATGSDYYLSDQRTISPLAKLLHGQFGGELKTSAQHFSYDHAAGKNLYRVNAYLEIPEFTKGDVIKREDSYFYILGVSHKVKAENLMTGQQESFPYEQGTTQRLPIRTTQVSSIDPVEVLHPASYQSVVPTNSKYAPAELDVDDEVSVAVDGEYLFLIPHTKEKEVIAHKRKRHSQKRKTKDDDLVTDD
jgi:NMD protein affecting ribosome stability and mRNA decay